MAALPRSAPASRMLWSLDRRGWVALAFEDVDGVHPGLPWRPGELRRVLEMVTAMAVALSPAPPTTTSIADRLRESFAGWRRLAAAHAAGDDDLTGLDPWSARHLDRLARLEASWPQATEGSTLLHLDLRADNLLLTPTGVVAVDWPYACAGPPGWTCSCSCPAWPCRAAPTRSRPSPPTRWPPAPILGRSRPPSPPVPGAWPKGPACLRRPASPPSAPSSTGRPWSPSSGCGCGPAGPDRSRPPENW